jgi:hypothetical protein
VIFNNNGLNAGVVAGDKREIRKLDLEADDGAQVEVNATNGMRVRTG